MLDDSAHILLNERLEALQTSVLQLQDMVALLTIENVKLDWLNEKRTMSLTGLSRSTLLSLRKQGKLSSSSLATKAVFYRLSEIKRLLDKNEMNR